MPDTDTPPAPPSVEPTDATANGLTRATINLRPRAVADLDAMTTRHGMAKTDVIDRAIRLAALVDSLTDAAGAFRIVAADGSVERIHLL